MSDAISDAIRAGHDAFNRGDYESWIAAYDQDVEFHDLGDTFDTGIFHGHAGIRVWLAKLQEAWGEEFRFEPTSVTRGGDAVMVDTRAIGVGVGSGIPIEMIFYNVMRFRHDKIVWTKGFTDRAKALKAAGIAE